MTGVRNLAIEQGVEFAERYAWTSGGTRQVLAGFTPRAHLRSAFGAPLLFDFGPYLSIVPGVEVNGVSGDVVELRVPADQTRRIRRGGVWDLFLVDSVGGEQTRSIKLLAGAVAVTSAVTEASSDD